jgi:hypothetical protein
MSMLSVITVMIKLAFKKFADSPAADAEQLRHLVAQLAQLHN